MWSARQLNSRWAPGWSVSSTRHWCSSRLSRAYRAMLARRLNSHVRICMSPVIGQLNTSRASRLRRNFLGSVV